MEDIIVQVKAVLSTTAAHWKALTETLPADMLTRRPAPGEWSAMECLQHLVDTERMVFPVRLQALLAGRDFEAFNPDAQGTALADTLTPASLAGLAQVTDADLPRTAHHSELGIVTLAEFLNEWAAHDLNHTVQADRAVMQPFIAGCGLWRSYFADHDLAHRTRT
jgi:hypothetical protein